MQNAAAKIAEDVTKNDPRAEQLLMAAFGKLRELDQGDTPSRLFPRGIQSIDLEVDFGAAGSPELRLKLNISAAMTDAGAAMALSAPAEVPAPTFNAEGHHVIVEIARLDLASRAPAVLQQVEAVLLAVNRSLQAAATFPDDIRNSQPQTKPFHFIDIPFRDGGPANPPLPPAPHVLSKIGEFTDQLTSGAGSPIEKADALSWVIHLFGDVHQPLHCINHLSTLHPAGDLGGNLFRLAGAKNNLHSLWDSSVDNSGGGDASVLAAAIAQQHTRASLATDLHVTVPEKWARASYLLAKRNAYTLVENPAHPPLPSAAYRANAEKVGRRQAALAGYRLADHLAQIFH